MELRAPEERTASLQQLFEFEQHKLLELRRQQDKERSIPSGRPELLNPDILTCEEMIRIWRVRLESPTPPAQA